MKNVKNSLRKTELFIFLLGLAISLLLGIILLYKNHYEWELLLGYFIGSISFSATLEYLLLISSKPKVSRIGFFFLTNLKLVIIFALFYTFRLIGIPILNLVIGFLACQTIAVFALSAISLYSNKDLKASEQTLTAKI